MSDVYLIKKETLTSIADKIREKAPNNWGDVNVTPEDVYEAAIEDVWQEGHDVGYNEGKSNITLQNKTVTPTTSKQTVTAGSGYDGLGTVTVNAMPTATQATPSISIDANGKISASATQSAGYVSAGTKTSTKQMTVQAAKTITPSTTSQTAVAKNVYTTGAVTVAGDSNLKAENIKSGVSIFGVAGNYEGSGGSGGSGSGSVETCTLELITDNYFNVINYSTVDSEGKIVWERIIQPYDNQISCTAVCGTLVCVMLGTDTTMTLSNASVVYNPKSAIKVFGIPADASGTVTATFSTVLEW